MLDLELKYGIMAARLAAKITIKARKNGDIWENACKEGEEPYTQADLASQAIILSVLSDHFRGDQIWAEESSSSIKNEEQFQEIASLLESCGHKKITRDDLFKALDFRGHKKSDRVWTVDPIDGTKGYIANLQYAIAIGLLIKGQPMLGIIAAPAEEKIYYAQKEKGAWMEALFPKIEEKANGVGYSEEKTEIYDKKSISISQCTPEQAIVLASRAHDSPFTQSIMQKIGASRVNRCDSQVKYAQLARGLAHVYIRPPSSRTNLAWDHVPGIAILAEAGGKITDLDGKDLDFSSCKMEKNRGILATNKIVHHAFLQETRLN